MKKAAEAVTEPRQLSAGGQVGGIPETTPHRHGLQTAVDGLVGAAREGPLVRMGWRTLRPTSPSSPSTSAPPNPGRTRWGRAPRPEFRERARSLLKPSHPVCATENPAAARQAKRHAERERSGADGRHVGTTRGPRPQRRRAQIPRAPPQPGPSRLCGFLSLRPMPTLKTFQGHSTEVKS